MAKAVEKIAAKIYADWGVSGQWMDRTVKEKEPWLKTARTILSDPDIIEVDKDAELPEPKDGSISYESARTSLGAWVKRFCYLVAQQDMLKAGWVKEKK